jgi:hypothetical protein
MKTIKIVLVILAVIVVEFFMSRLIYPQLSYQTSVAVEHPMDKTFAM